MTSLVSYIADRVEGGIAFFQLLLQIVCKLTHPNIVWSLWLYKILGSSSSYVWYNWLDLQLVIGGSVLFGPPLKLVQKAAQVDLKEVLKVVHLYRNLGKRLYQTITKGRLHRVADGGHTVLLYDCLQDRKGELHQIDEYRLFQYFFVVWS